VSPPDPRLAIYAEVVGHRWAWPGLEHVVIDGKRVNAETVVVEVLRAADGIGLLRDSAEPPQASAVDVESAARLLATYHVRYEEPPNGRGWQGVLDSLEHAYAQALKAARTEKVRDRIDNAYAVLRGEEVRRGSSQTPA
jgi:hypothetical protein